MPTNEKGIEESHRLVQDAEVTLFVIETDKLSSAPLSTVLNGGIGTFYFTPSIKPDGSFISWGGHEFIAASIDATGYAKNSQGRISRPVLSIGNVLGIVLPEVLAHGNLNGARVTRYKTWAKFLDDGDDPDPNAYLTKDVYTIDRLSGLDGEVIQWEMTSVLDQQGKMLPGKQVLPNCGHTYRAWNPETQAFDYTRSTCPYDGSACFDKANKPASPSEDACSKNLKGCRARYGNGVLPYWGFPSIGRIS